MTDDYRTNYVLMKKCDRNNQKQLWKCVGDKKYNIVQLQSGRYMYNGNNKYVTTKATSSDLTKWMRYTTKKDVCSQGEILYTCTFILLLTLPSFIHAGTNRY
jgi:hypothetical protein